VTSILRSAPTPAYRAKTTNRPPLKMSAVVLPEELRDGLASIALSVFTDMVNDGKPFQDAILAVYLSGLNHGAMGGGNG